MRKLLAVAIVALAALTLAPANAQTEGSRYVGDANCDMRVGPVDAAVILQYDARLLDALACAENADTTWDGVTNSADAALVLQYEVGVYEGFVRMVFGVAHPDAVCDDDEFPTACTIPAGAEVEVSLALLNPIPRGYVAVQTYIYFGALDYHSADQYEEVLWPDAVMVLRAPVHAQSVRVVHGAATAWVPPRPLSEYLGKLTAIRMSCSGPGTHTVVSLPFNGERFDEPYTLGSGVGFLGGSPLSVFPAQTYTERDVDLNLDGSIQPYEEDRSVAAALDITCVAP